MKTLALFTLVSLVAFVTSNEKPTLEVHSPSYYRCPFHIFDSGLPMADENGDTLYCDVNGAMCPNGYFCNPQDSDGRDVCCHILGP